MNDLRKAAQMAMTALAGLDADDVYAALRAALAQPEYPLPDSIYPDSKDWVASDYAGRVEWLHFMYESKKREVEHLEAAQMALEALDDACGNRCNAENNPCYQRIVAEVLRAALAQPEHVHEWFTTGAMPIGKMRCLQCGEWRVKP